jgi:hypothetical protein
MSLVSVMMNGFLALTAVLYDKEAQVVHPGLPLLLLLAL